MLEVKLGRTTSMLSDSPLANTAWAGGPANLIGQIKIDEVDTHLLRSYHNQEHSSSEFC